MAFNSITRLRLRSFFTLPAFLREAQASAAQAGRSAGFISGALLAEGRMVFWTRTAWESEDAMKALRVAPSERLYRGSIVRGIDLDLEVEESGFAGEGDLSLALERLRSAA